MRCVRLPMERRNGTFNTTNTYVRLLRNPVASVFIFDFCKSEEEKKNIVQFMLLSYFVSAFYTEESVWR